MTSIVLLIGITSTVEAYNTYDFNNAILGMSAFFCIMWIVVFIVWIVITIWAYKDAQKRGMNAILWALIVFFIGIIGLIIYLVVRGEHNKKSEQPGRICPACGRPIPMDAQICPYCGKDFRPPK